MSVFETVFDCDRLYFWKYSNGNDNRNLSKNKCRWKTMFFVNLANGNQLQFKNKIIIVVKFMLQKHCASLNIWKCRNKNMHWKLVLKKESKEFFLFWTPKINFWTIRTIRKCNFSVADDMLVATCKSLNHILKK